MVRDCARARYDSCSMQAQCAHPAPGEQPRCITQPIAPAARTVAERERRTERHVRPAVFLGHRRHLHELARFNDPHEGQLDRSIGALALTRLEPVCACAERDRVGRLADGRIGKSTPLPRRLTQKHVLPAEHRAGRERTPSPRERERTMEHSCARGTQGAARVELELGEWWRRLCHQPGVPAPRRLAPSQREGGGRLPQGGGLHSKPREAQQRERER
eukprot:scaffold107516_cov29-Tisochrysis_lutea.AAC.1